tara:strand:+ start:80 stop:481 length:402 start_codon:yes stop_codon:yes gene_type:complete
MKFKINQIKEEDWSFLPQWWINYKQDPPPREFLPENGLSGFIIKKNEPIAAMWLYQTNSKTAIPAIVVSNKNYKEKDRSDALQLLLSFTTNAAEELGFKYSFAWAKSGVMLEKYEKLGFTKDEKPSYELILKH